MTTTETASNGILACCGGYAEHFDYCSQGMREEAARRNAFMNVWLEPVAEPTPLQRAKDLLRPNVERDAAWLDEVKPGWVDLIDLDTLNLSNGRFCICGQAFYQEARERQDSNGFSFADGLLWDSSAYSDDYGFAMTNGPTFQEFGRAVIWRALDELWVELIRSRRKESAERLGDVEADAYRDRADATLDAHTERGEA